MNTTIYAVQALLEAAAEDRVPTGEPCRCPEHVLNCECGAYQGSTR